jgi:hypothetical protein
VAQEIPLWHGKLRLPRIERYSIPHAFLENLLQMMQMFLIRLGENGDVIQVYNHKFVFLPHKSNVHGCLESDPCVHQPKGHLVIHECPPWGSECCFFFIIFTHCYMVITKVSIQQGNYVYTYHPL